EKVVAAASNRLVIMADGTKLVDRLGTTARLPVEVVAFGWEATADRVARLAEPVLRRGRDGQPFRTDGGNFILDCACGPIADPSALESALARIVGVIDSGLFIGMADVVLVATETGVIRLDRVTPGVP